MGASWKKYIYSKIKTKSQLIISRTIIFKNRKLYKLNMAKAKEKPVWLKTSLKDVEDIVEKLAKQDITPEKIGLILRDRYGIPTTRIYGKKLGKILKEKGIYNDSELTNLEKKQEKLKQHLEKNKQDKKSRRALTIVAKKISKVKKYKNKRSKKKR
jgi:small subunit ribosomal protein S15